jgi:hypothetical protein
VLSADSRCCSDHPLLASLPRDEFAGLVPSTPIAVLGVEATGSGATAIAVVSNGVVVKIIITDAGVGYTSTPSIAIGSPPFVPTLSIAVSTVRVTQHIVLGRNCVLESSTVKLMRFHYSLSAQR